MKIYSTYKTTEKPWGGANNFLRALKATLSDRHGAIFTEDVEEADIIFMNQLSSGPGDGSSAYTFSKVKNLKNKKQRAKLVIRAVNLKCHSEPAFLKYYLAGNFIKDRNIIKSMNMADAVIFQSEYQKSFFLKAGYKGPSQIIYNGASEAFKEAVPRPPLPDNEDIRILVTSFAKGRVKRHDFVANLSEQSGVKVHYAGQWPSDTDPRKTVLCGVLSHSDLKELMAGCHYLCHPASRDCCPNSIMEALHFGMPVLYNPAKQGTGEELAGKYGIPIHDNLDFVIAEARRQYVQLCDKLSPNRYYYGIDRAADEYYSVFHKLLEKTHA
jgi:glycosyltransferase involved in cell wall biosynthesis